MLKGKHILLGISGGIAAYKCAHLIRLFVKAGAEVKVVVTSHALEFVTRTTLETLSKNQVHCNLFEWVEGVGTEHISVTDWADLFLVAPATANIIGKLANGIADDTLSTYLLAFDKQIYLAPSMNPKMLNNKALQRNLTVSRGDGVAIIEPTTGELACDYEGAGRMEEPEQIIAFIQNHQQLLLP